MTSARHIARTVCLAGLLSGFSSAGLQAQTPSFQSSNEDARLKEAIQGSLRFLVVEHIVRVATQEKTRSELGGPFIGDYRRSVRMPRQWGDQDPAFTNYVLHPLQGATTGYIWLDSRRETTTAFSREAAYWHSRLRAAAWAGGYSMQFEIGPISEASIGNVGMNSAHAGWVDHVMTPAGGFAVMIGEDVVDRFVLRRLEERINSPLLRAVFRISLNPSRATANVMSIRSPWHRAERPIRGN